MHLYSEIRNYCSILAHHSPRNIPIMIRRSTCYIMVIMILLSLTGKGQTPLVDSNHTSVLGNAGLASALLFTGSFLMDEPLRDISIAHQNRFMDSYTHLINYMGSKKVVLPLNAVLFTGGLVFKDTRLQHTAFNAFKSIVGSAGITFALKHLTGRERPYTGQGAYSFDPFPVNQHAFRSLPSGHATLAFAFMTPFAEQYSRWLYLIPLSVGFSRIYKDKHWTSDVILGSALGFISGYFFQHKQKHIECTLNKVVIRF